MAKNSPRDEVLAQIRAMRKRVDPDVLRTAQNYARIQLGMPVELNQAARMLLRATANGGRQRSVVLAELEQWFGKDKRKH
ncbi:MAG: hypothetical protein FJX35_14340 [Alphaproteobacteria bacterium]|nr:hypothetical protein [Alphaproteobacteria bacterium]